MKIFRAVIPALLLLSGAAVQAQTGADAILGKWNIEFERGRRIENGESTPIMGKGTLVVVKAGSGYSGTLDGGPRPDGSMSPPSIMPGESVAGGGFVFHQTSKAQVNVNGDEQEIEIKSTWTLIPSGESISGELVRVIPNMPDAGGATQVKGMRVK